MTFCTPEHLQSTQVLVVGDVMLDRYWVGPTARISPEAPVPVVRIQKDETRPGGAANVALNIASVGGHVRLIGVVGRDDAAKKLRDALVEKRVQPDFTETASCPTITKLRVLSRNQQLIRLDFEESLAVAGAFNREDYLASYKAALADCSVVILSDYGKGTLADAEAMIAAARAMNRPVLVDPKGSDWRPYRGATLITPNLSELEAVVGPCPDEATIVAKGTRLRDELGIDALLVTRSENGMTLLAPNQPPLHLPTRAREVFDVTGAGDTVIATFGAALAAGHDYAHAARIANLAAGIVVAKLGTATVTPAELLRAIRRQHEDDSAVLAEDELIERVRAAQAQGQLTVYCGVQEDWCRPMVDAFEKATGVKVSMIRKSSGEIYAQVKAEASNPRGDIWWGGTGDPHLQSAEEGLTDAYVSPTRNQLHDWANRQAVASKVRTVGIYSGALGFGYNEELLKKQNLPVPACWSSRHSKKGSGCRSSRR